MENTISSVPDRNPSTTTNTIEIKEEQQQSSTPTQFHQEKTKMHYWVLLIINYSSLFLGSLSSSLLSRFYFIHGGSSRWVSTWVQSAGFPLLLIPIYLPDHLFNFKSPTQIQTQIGRPFSLFTPKLFLISISIGLMLGFNNFLFSYGVSYLPLSTSSLLLSTQLAFNLILSVLLVKQRLTFTNLNSVILLTLSSVLLALDSNHDRPNGLTQTHYYMGFFSILGAALLFALYLPLIEMTYKRVQNFKMVMEMQLVMEITAVMLATVGLASDGGFKEIERESKVGFDLGCVLYWLTLGFNVVSWQLCFIGTAGLVFLTTSLTGGICMTALLPMNVLGSVLVYGDEFNGEKVISTLLCVWGFCSYVYGEYVKLKEKREMVDHNEMETVGVL